MLVFTLLTKSEAILDGWKQSEIDSGSSAWVYNRVNRWSVTSGL